MYSKRLATQQLHILTSQRIVKLKIKKIKKEGKK